MRNIWISFAISTCLVGTDAGAQCVSRQQAQDDDAGTAHMLASRTAVFDIAKSDSVANWRSVLLRSGALSKAAAQTGDKQVLIVNSDENAIVGSVSVGDLADMKQGFSVDPLNPASFGQTELPAQFEDASPLPTDAIGGLSQTPGDFSQQLKIPVVVEHIVDGDGRTPLAWQPLPPHPAMPGHAPRPGGASDIPVGDATTDADAVVAVSVGGFGQQFNCNGVQIGPGLILTNRHCVPLPQYKYQIHFGVLQERSPPGYIFPANVPFVGEFRCDAKEVVPPGKPTDYYDFALLQIGNLGVAGSRAMTVQMDHGSELQAIVDGSSPPGVKMVQTGLSDADPAHYLQRQQQIYDAASSDTCKLVNPVAVARADQPLACKDTEAVYYDPSGIEHTCDSTNGTSGSPLFSATTGHLIALHRATENRKAPNNCAVPASWIYQSFKHWSIKPQCSVADYIDGKCH